MTVDRVWLWFVPVHGEHSVTSRRALMMFFGVNLSMIGWLVSIWKSTIFNGQIHYNIWLVLWNHGSVFFYDFPFSWEESSSQLTNSYFSEG